MPERQKRRLREGDDALPDRPVLAESVGQPLSEVDVLRRSKILLGSNPRLRFWHERGVDRATLRRLKIGWNGKEGRYSIPVFDADGVLVNIKRYRPGAESHKNIQTKGHGRGCRWFGAERVARNGVDVPVYVCGGEPDAIRLSVEKLLAVSGTHGEGTVPLPDELRLLRGRKVRIIYDVDPAGVGGAKKLAKAVQAAGAAEVRVIKLAFPDKYGKDLTDWFSQGNTKADLLRLVRSTQPEGSTAAGRRPVADLLRLALAEAERVGSRNAGGFYLAKQLQDERYTRDEARRVVVDEYRPLVTDLKEQPYTVDEAVASVASAYSTSPREPSGLGVTRTNVLGQILSRSELATLPKPAPMIDGWLDLRTSVMVIGETGTNKTFALLGWACSVATGKPWLGHEVTIDPAPVLMVVGEGGGGLDARIAAWETANGVDVPDAMLTVSLRPISINDQVFWDEIAVEAVGRGVRLVILDTFSSLAPEAREVEDSAPALRRMSDLAAAIDGAVVLAHHTGWSEKGRARGGSQFESNTDSTVILSKDGDAENVVEIWRKKDKEGPSGLRVYIERVPVNDSCVLEATDGGTALRRAEKLTANELEKQVREIVVAEPFVYTETALANKIGKPARKIIKDMVEHGDLVVEQVLQPEGVNRVQKKRGRIGLHPSTNPTASVDV